MDKYTGEPYIVVPILRAVYRSNAVPAENEYEYAILTVRHAVKVSVEFAFKSNNIDKCWYFWY